MTDYPVFSFPYIKKKMYFILNRTQREKKVCEC